MSRREDEVICQVCGSILASYKGLKVHQKTVRKCLEKQGKVLPPSSRTHKCEHCPKAFVSSQKRDMHQSKCAGRTQELCRKRGEEIKTLTEKMGKMREEMAELRGQLAIYKGAQDTLNKLAQQPRSVSQINNTVNNTFVVPPLFPHSLQDIERIVNEHFTLQDLQGGIDGVANFFVRRILTDSHGRECVYLSDEKRGTVKYFLSGGEMVVDYGMCGMSRQVSPIMVKKAGEFTPHIFDDGVDTKTVMETTEVLQQVDANHEDTPARLGKAIWKKLGGGGGLAPCPPHIENPFRARHGQQLPENFISSSTSTSSSSQN